MIEQWISFPQKNFEAYCWRIPTIRRYHSNRRRSMVHIVISTWYEDEFKIKY